MPAKLTTEEFIRRARKVHGNTYDYSKVVYEGKDKPVMIICKEHGEFEQTPNNHWKGKGCWKCAGVKPLTQEEFIQKSREVHGDKYDYSKSVYVKNDVKVTITCPLHGDFEQVPMSHMKGIGCPVCGNEARHRSKREYLKRAETRKATCLSKYGVENIMQVPGTVDKVMQSRKLHKKHNDSAPERIAEGLLTFVFGEDGVIPQYKSDLYPYYCDFYVKPLDAYIELHLHWSHGGHFYDETNDADRAVLDTWKSRASEGKKVYSTAVNTWSFVDVNKLRIAKENHLNYFVFWDTDLSDFKEWLKQYRFN